MRYEDASHTGAFQGQGPVANDDLELVAAGSKSAATGNLITGDGTQSGSAGADSAAGAHITAIAGKSGEDTSFAGGKLSVEGEYGKLSVDAEGNYVYQANKGVENVRDRFTYTLADNQGATDSAALIVEIGKTPVVIKADAQQIVPGPDGVVTLPPGVELSDVHVVGRNLVIDMPDGTQLVIIDGAVFVPQLVVNGVEVPATNVAALLVGQEIQPAAGELPPSSGGNFAVPPPPLDPGVPLGDLIPPTEYNYQPPEPQEVLETVDREPEIQIQPDGQPAAVNAVDSVDEKGLPTRNGGEPEGSGEEAAAGADGDPSEATAGTIIIDSPDGVDSVTITDGNGVAHEIFVGLVIQGDFGTLTITGIVGNDYTYSYVLTDNTSGDDTHDDFVVTLTDNDGDQAVATLVIDIIDDVPTARPDTDALAIGENVATGNVITDAAAGDAGDSDNGRDTVGADNAHISAVSSVNVPANTDTDAGANFQIAGQYGVLVLNTDGSYTYTKNADAPGGVQDVFNYTITDGDGDTSTTTLTITIPDQFPELENPDAVLLDDDALANGNPGGTGDDVDSQGTPGQLQGTGGDGELDYNFTGDNTLPAGFTTAIQPNGDLWVMQGTTHVLTVTLDHETGGFSVTQVNPIDHPAGGDENNLSFQIGVEVVDADGDTAAAHISINVDDDTPELGEVLSQGDVTLDETSAGSPAGFPISDTSALPVIDFTPSFGADGAAAVNATVFGLSITGGPDSGLQTADGDFPIELVQVDAHTIEGHYDGNNVAFVITIDDNGFVTLTQNVPLEHLVDGNTPADYNDSLDLGGLIAATVTITDGDGDTASQSVGIGDGLVFLDDGPSANNDTDSVGDVGDTATGNVITGSGTNEGTANADDPGADGFGSITLLASDNVPANSDGNPAGGFTVQGEFGLLQMDADGNYTYTRDPGTPGGAQDVFTYTYQDADGDFVSATLTITLGDATPTAGNVDVQLDDDALANGNPGGTGDDPDATNVSGNLPGSGGDAPLTFAVLLTGEPAGFDYVSGGAGIVLIQQGGETKLTVTVNPDGSYSVVQNNPIEHPDGLNENNVQFTVNYTVTDSDGDVANGTISIDVDDDTPTATATQLTGTVDEDGVVEGAADNGPGDGIAGGVGDVAGQAVSATGNVSSLFSSGADTPLTYQLLANFAGLNAQNLTSGGVALSYDVVLAAGVYTLTATAGGETVFTFTLNATTGAYNFTLVDQLDHVSGNNENDLAINLSSIIQATDNDADSVTAGANGLIITVDDDTPIATNTQLTGTVDEDGVVENGAVGIQYGDGIPGGTGDVAGEVVTASGNISTLFQSGADAPLTYQMLNTFAALTAQGLTSGGVALTYNVALNAGVYTLTATAGGSTVFTLTLNATTGAYTFTLVDQLDHPTLNDLAGDNTENDLAINLSSILQATDADGDSVAAGSNGLIITVDDDSPVINSVTSPLQVDNDANPSATGTFDFDIGADENSDHDDITVSNFTVLVNGQPVSESLVAGPETATTASYTFSFDYDTGTGGTATATGTLVFDKIAGTYTVELTNGPIEGFSLLSTGAADASDFVSYQVPDGGSGAPEVTVAALDTDFFVQFSGVAEPGSGTGSNNLFTTVGGDGTFSPVTTANFAGLELFTQDIATIQVSNAAAGVAGNTIQGGEVLDLNLYSTDPMGTLGGVPTQSSTSMFMTLDGIGGSEDMIVVLKLLDTSTGEYTTKAIIVQNADILTDADAASLVGTAYEGLGAALDNNDGLIVIEADDYQGGNTNLVIVGAQIAGSDEGITGTGINLNGAVDSDTVDGSSSGTQTFDTDVSDAPFKITSIGFLTTSTEDQTASIDFDVTVEDADGDAVTQHITVDIGTSSPALLPPDPESSSTTLSTESLLADDSGTNEQLQKTAANSNTLTLATAVAAAGLAEEPVAASLPDDSSHGQDVSEVAASVGSAVQGIADDAGYVSRSAVGEEAGATAHEVNQTASSGHSEAPANSDLSLDDSQASAPASNEAAANDDQGPAADAAAAGPVAPSVMMVSAEALQAAGLEDNVQHGGAVEKIIADALAHGNAPETVDALLNAIHGGNGGEHAIANLATAHGNAVSAWDMASNGGSAGGAEMLMKVGAEMLHHDMVQPTHNG